MFKNFFSKQNIGENKPNLTKVVDLLKDRISNFLVDSGDLHLQIDKPVKFELRSLDVLHNFYVPQFRGKMDMVPGMITFYWLTPIRTGDFEVLCAEYCGTGHYAMRGRVIVDEEKDYNQWLAKQITFEKMLAQNQKENKKLKFVKNNE